MIHLVPVQNDSYVCTFVFWMNMSFPRMCPASPPVVILSVPCEMDQQELLYFKGSKNFLASKYHILMVLDMILNLWVLQQVWGWQANFGVKKQIVSTVLVVQIKFIALAGWPSMNSPCISTHCIKRTQIHINKEVCIFLPQGYSRLELSRSWNVFMHCGCGFIIWP